MVDKRRNSVWPIGLQDHRKQRMHDDISTPRALELRRRQGHLLTQLVAKTERFALFNRIRTGAAFFFSLEEFSRRNPRSQKGLDLTAMHAKTQSKINLKFFIINITINLELSLYHIYTAPAVQSAQPQGMLKARKLRTKLENENPPQTSTIVTIYARSRDF